jgi:hypothetical protein
MLPVRVLNCFVRLIFGIRKGLADDGSGTRLAGRIGVAYREFCQPWPAAQRDAIGRIKLIKKVQGC